jgi:hypothetical protein
VAAAVNGRRELRLERCSGRENRHVGRRDRVEHRALGDRYGSVSEMLLADYARRK